MFLNGQSSTCWSRTNCHDFSNYRVSTFCRKASSLAAGSLKPFTACDGRFSGTHTKKHNDIGNFLCEMKVSWQMRNWLLDFFWVNDLVWFLEYFWINRPCLVSISYISPSVSTSEWPLEGFWSHSFLCWHQELINALSFEFHHLETFFQRFVSFSSPETAGTSGIISFLNSVDLLNNSNVLV